MSYLYNAIITGKRNNKKIAWILLHDDYDLIYTYQCGWNEAVLDTFDRESRCCAETRKLHRDTAVRYENIRDKINQRNICNI